MMACCTHPLIILTKALLKERKRRCCHTVWEIISGILVFGVLILMRQIVKNDIDDIVLAQHSADKELDYIAYYPKTTITDRFMPKVLDNLATEKRLYSKGFYTKTEMLDDLRSNNNKTKAVIYFRSINETLPHLDYTIGLIDDHVQHKRKFMSILPKPIDEEKPASLQLMQLQWAIDRSFMEDVTGASINHKVSFPGYEKLEQHPPKHPLDVIYHFLIFCTMIAPLPFFLYIHSRLIKERRIGLKELLRIMGVSSTMLRCSRLLDTFFMSLIYATLITILLKVTNTPIVPNSDFFVVACTIILHFLNITSMAFLTSVLSQTYDHAYGMALMVYIITCSLCVFWYNFLHHSAILTYFGCFMLPHAPVSLFWDEVKYMECAGEGVHFGNIATRHSSIYSCVPVIVTWVAIVLQLLTVLCLTWYLDMVVPGVFGVPQRKDFLFRRDFWMKRKKVHFNVTSEKTRAIMRDLRFFQKLPMNVPVAIKLVHVSKVEVANEVDTINNALTEINLDIYQGEVTVILGVEGAGKSTLVSVITGMTKATVGNVYVNGYDATLFMRYIRKELGYCPQYHLTFDYLTVEENIILFERLRGERQEDRTTTNELLDRLHLKSKADMYSYELSPSAERCLQVACALAGGADILILDEPTSNCDSETRYYLWDIIMELRGAKTIVMTTSSIEEADAVGDRIALLSKGRLKCHGTPKFLKNAIGTGFNLSVTLKNKSDSDAVRALVENTVHGTVTTKIDARRILFTLPAKDHELFPDLFDALEVKKTELGIRNMGVGMSLEEMFLGFIDDDDRAEDSMWVETFHGYTQLSGWRLAVQQIRVLMTRNFAHMWNVKYQFTILQIIVPVIGLIVISVSTNSYRHESDSTSGKKSMTVLVEARDGIHDNLNEIEDLYPNVKLYRIGQASTAFTDIKHKSVNWPDKNTVKFVMKPGKSELYIGLHSLPTATKALNTFSNIYMSDMIPQLEPPISLTVTEIDLLMPKDAMLCLFWAIGVTFFIAIPLIKFISISIQDHRYRVRHTHRAVGCPNSIHWVAKLLSQMALFLLFIPPTVLLCAKNLDKEDTLTSDEFLGAMYLAQLLFLVGFLLQLYVCSFCLDEHDAVTQIYIHCIVFGFTGSIIQRLLIELKESSPTYKYFLEILSLLGSLSPVFTLSEIVTRYTTVARAKSFCSHNDHYCKNLVATDSKASILDTICCKPDRKLYSYFSGPSLILLMTLLFHIWFYGIILVLMQKKIIHNFFERIVNCNYAEPKLNKTDLNVVKEKVEVDRMVNCVKNPKTCVGERPPDGTLLVQNLHKKFFNCFLANSRDSPVKGVNFKVDAGDSLVLLGPHKSGKTTVLYMIAGNMPLTRGDCYIGGTSLKDQRSKFIDKTALTQSIGGLDRFSTGFNNLKRLCMLHGLKSDDAAVYTVHCMSYMGLMHLMHVPVSAYSPGSARRLVLCGALLAAPPVLLVEEVMKQLEPHTRPLVRRALSSLRSRGCIVIMSEHSIVWRDLDYLNSRLAVLHEGQIIALGPIEHIRALLADGHMARLKLKRKPVTKFRELNEEFTEGQVTRHLKYQSTNKSAALSGLNYKDDQESDGSLDHLDKVKVKPSGKNKPRATRQTIKPASKEEEDDVDDTDEITTSSKFAKAKVDTVARNYKNRLSQIKLKTLSDEDESSDSIQIEIVHIPVEENKELDASSTEKAENKEEAENIQSTEEEKSKNMPEKKHEAEYQAGTSGQQPEGDQNLRLVEKSEDSDKTVGSDKSSREEDKLKKSDGKSQPEEGQTIRLTEKPGETHKSGTTSDNNSQGGDQAGSSGATDKAAENGQNLTLPKSDKFVKKKESENSFEDIFLAYENPIQIEESENLFDFKPSVLSVSELKRDFKVAFPTSNLAEEHTSMLYFHIKGERNMKYSYMFSKLEHLKIVYKDLLEDYTLSEISIEDVYCKLESERLNMNL